MGVYVTAACLLVIAPCCWCQAGVDSASRYTSKLLPSLSRRHGRVGGAGVGLGTGSDGAGIGVGVGGFDDLSNPIGGGGGLAGLRGAGAQGHHINQCGSVAPECLATPLDRHPECKYAYDITVGGCVKIDVSAACGFISGGAGSIFNTVIECERSCL